MMIRNPIEGTLEESEGQSRGEVTDCNFDRRIEKHDKTNCRRYRLRGGGKVKGIIRASE